MKRLLLLLFVSVLAFSSSAVCAFTSGFSNSFLGSGTLNGTTFTGTLTSDSHWAVPLGYTTENTFPDVTAEWYFTGVFPYCGGDRAINEDTRVITITLPASIECAGGLGKRDFFIPTYGASTSCGADICVNEYYHFYNSGTDASPVWSFVTPPFLGFPLDCSTPGCSGTGNISYLTNGAYTNGTVISVFDHSMDTPYGNEDGIVTAWNGEEGTGTPATQGCYPGSGAFSVGGTYVGSPNDGCSSDYLNYDSHPGYDYKAAIDTPVYAAADGTITETQCPSDGSSCTGVGRIRIHNANGYTVWYLHLSSQIGHTTEHPDGLSVSNTVEKGELIGYTGDTGVSGSPHLHFEVRKENGSTFGLPVDPYGWTYTGHTDPYTSFHSEIINVLLWD